MSGAGHTTVDFMDEKDKEQFEAILVRAIQSGKKETSDLVDDLNNKFLGAVRQEIKITVNGKIDGIKKHLEDQDSVLSDITQELQLLKTNTQPVIDIRRTVIDVARFITWLAAVIIAVGSIFVGLLAMTKFFKWFN